MKLTKDILENYSDESLVRTFSEVVGETKEISDEKRSEQRAAMIDEIIEKQDQIKVKKDDLRELVSEKTEEATRKATQHLEGKIDSLEKELKASSRQISFNTKAESDGKIKEKVGQFFRALSRRDFDKVRSLSEGTDADGGYLVHPEFIRDVLRVADETGLARKFCRKIPMKSTEKSISTLSNGVSTYWVGEGAAITASKPEFGKKTINAKKLAGLAFGTNELIDDAEDAEIFTLLRDLFVDAFTAEEDAQFLRGDGTTFTGILNETGTNVVTMGAGDTTFDKLDANDLNKVMRAVATKYKKGTPKWFLSQDVLGIIERLQDTQGQYIYRKPIDGEVGTLWGYPIVVTDAMEITSAADTKFIAFGDAKYVALGDRKKITFEEAREATINYDGSDYNLFQQDQKAIRGIERVGFKVLIPEAFSILKTAA